MLLLGFRRELFAAERTRVVDARVLCEAVWAHLVSAHQSDTPVHIFHTDGARWCGFVVAISERCTTPELLVPCGFRRKLHDKRGDGGLVHVLDGLLVLASSSVRVSCANLHHTLSELSGSRCHGGCLLVACCLLLVACCLLLVVWLYTLTIWSHLVSIFFRHFSAFCDTHILLQLQLQLQVQLQLQLQLQVQLQVQLQLQLQVQLQVQRDVTQNTDKCRKKIETRCDHMVRAYNQTTSKQQASNNKRLSWLT